MRGTWRTGLKPFGVPLLVNWTFLLWSMVLWSFGFAKGGQILAALTFSLLFHEYAHVMMARILGHQASDVTVFVFGGAARIPSLADMRPSHEALVAAAGPLSSFVLAFLVYIATLPFGVSVPWILKQAFVLNVGLAIFNTLPLFPMDGGRLLRSALSAKIGHGRSTNIAVWTTTILGGIIVILSAIASYWNLAIILSLVVLMAHGEKAADAKRRTRDMMIDRLRAMGYEVEDQSVDKDGIWSISCRKRDEAP